MCVWILTARRFWGWLGTLRQRTEQIKLSIDCPLDVHVLHRIELFESDSFFFAPSLKSQDMVYPPPAPPHPTFFCWGAGWGMRWPIHPHHPNPPPEPTTRTHHPNPPPEPTTHTTTRISTPTPPTKHRPGSSTGCRWATCPGGAPCSSAPTRRCGLSSGRQRLWRGWGSCAWAVLHRRGRGGGVIWSVFSSCFGRCLYLSMAWVWAVFVGEWVLLLFTCAVVFSSPNMARGLFDSSFVPFFLFLLKLPFYLR